MANTFRIDSESGKIYAVEKILRAESYSQYAVAQDLINTAWKKVLKIRQKARQAYRVEKNRGYAEGLAQGRREIAAKITETVVASEAYMQDMEKRIVDTILATLKIVLDDMGPEKAMTQVVKKALKTAKSDEPLKIRVSPSNRDHVRRTVKQLAHQTQDLAAIEIVVDKDLDDQSCVLVSPVGSTDVSLDVQLKSIRKVLTARIAELKKHAA